MVENTEDLIINQNDGLNEMIENLNNNSLSGTLILDTKDYVDIYNWLVELKIFRNSFQNISNIFENPTSTPVNNEQYYTQQEVIF
jgi:hypothetical protein